MSRRGPRHKYAAEEVLMRILTDEKLFKVCEIVFSADRLIHASDVARETGISVGYSYILLKKLEKWGVVKGVRDPLNGRLAFKPGATKASMLVSDEIRRRKVKELEGEISRHIALEL